MSFPFFTETLPRPTCEKGESCFSILLHHNPTQSGEQFAERLVNELSKSRREFPKHDKIVGYIKNEDIPFLREAVRDRFGEAPPWLRIISNPGQRIEKM
jgi:hypothetical protein